MRQVSRQSRMCVSRCLSQASCGGLLRISIIQGLSQSVMKAETYVTCHSECYCASAMTADYQKFLGAASSGKYISKYMSWWSLIAS